MIRTLGASCALVVLLAGCSSEWFRYGPDPVDPARDRLPPVSSSSSYATANEFIEGFEALEAGDYVEAEALLRQSLSTKPSDPYALLAMGAVMERTGRPATAVLYYRSAMRYGETAPLGRTLALDGVTAKSAKTVRELALANIAQLEAQ